MTPEKPAPCPWCHSTASIQGSGEDARVVCDLPSCEACGPVTHGSTAAISSWNRVASAALSSPGPVPTVDEVAKVIAQEYDFSMLSLGRADRAARRVLALLGGKGAGA